MSESDSTIPLGYCQCGCGQKTNVAPKTNRALGRVKGRPYRFIQGHQRRKNIGPPYVIENRGFDTPCWIWQWSTTSQGYGKTSYEGRQVPAHVAFYKKQHGAIPPNLQLDHLCEVKSCVNPSHLELVTGAENTRRAKTTKLTKEGVANIRLFWSSGLFDQWEIAGMYRISQTHVSDIVNHKDWRD